MLFGNWTFQSLARNARQSSGMKKTKNFQLLNDALLHYRSYLCGFYQP